MGWKWDAARKHEVHIQVSPVSADESTVWIVWGDGAGRTETLKNGDVEKLLHSLAQQVQRLGYMM